VIRSAFDGDEPSIVYNLASALTLPGVSLEGLGRPAEALDAYTEAIAVCEPVEDERRAVELVYTESAGDGVADQLKSITFAHALFQLSCIGLEAQL